MNCIIVDDDHLTRMTIKNFIEETEGLSLIAECSSAVEAVKLLSKETVDLIFLDIQMPNMTGIELVKSLEQLPQIIFITGSSQHAIEAFEYDVVDYVMKPVSYARFLKAVKKAQKAQKNKKNTSKTDSIYIKVNSSLMKIDAKEIEWIEANGDYVTVNTTSKSYTVYSTLNGIESKLPPNDFLRIHRSYIVRIDKITAIDDYIVMINKKDIIVSKTYKKELMKRLNLI